MKNEKLNLKKVLDIMESRNWGYEYSGFTPNKEKIEKIISEIEDNLSLGVLELVCKSDIKFMIDEFLNSSEEDINEFASKYWADPVACHLIDENIEEGVIFKLI